MSENPNENQAVKVTNVKEQKALKKLIRIVVILMALAVAAAAVFFVCNNRVRTEYTALQAEIQQQNEEDEVRFNAEMNALRAQAKAAAATGVETVDVEAESLQSWETVLDETTWRLEDQSNQGLENTTTIEMTRAELMNGGLLLVNAWHELPSDFSADGLVSVGTEKEYSIPVEDGSVQLFPCAYRALGEALAAAKEEGLEHFIVREGYRSVATQTELFDNQMKKLAERYSGNRLITETKKVVNYPGTSDYHTGLSFRMDVYERGNAELNKQKFQADSEQGAWLTANCWKYGIIFRFPSRDFPNAQWEDKSYKTGVSSQLNLYRYVGKAHSVAMKVMGFCLEEYLEFLQDHPHICLYEDGALRYEIVRVRCNDSTQTLQLPKTNPASEVQGSLDNLGGVVMAYTY